MPRLRPIAAFLLGSALLPGCVTPPAKPQMAVKPVMKIRHAALGSSAAQYELGRYYQARGDLDLALRVYVQVLTFDSRNVEVRNAMATIYSQQGRFAEAESTLREAVAQSPDAAYLHNNLGYLHHLQGHHEAAIEELRTAINLDPKNEWARNNLETSRNALATLYSRQGRFAEAESTLREGIAQSPRAAYLHNNLGYLHYLQGNHEAAIEELRTAIRLDPKNEWGRNNLEMAQAALVRGPGSLAGHAETSPRQAPTTVAALEIRGGAEGLGATLNARASLGLQTVPEISKPIAPDDAPAAEGSAQIETASVSSMPAVAILTSNYQLEPGVAAAQLVQRERSVDSQMRTPIAAAGGEFRLEISNGNGVTGLARRVSRLLSRQGIPVHRITNQEPYRQIMTEIQYHHGFEQEAEKLRERLHGYAVVARVDTPRHLVDVRVVLGRDIKGHMAEIGTEEPAQVAILKSGTRQLE